MTLDPLQARETLAALGDTRRKLAADKAHWPWSRHAAFAGLAAGLAAAQSLPLPFNVAADGVLASGAGVIALVDRKRTGVFVNGWRPGPTRWVALGCVFLVVAAGLLGLWLSRDRGLHWAPLAMGAAAFALALAASKLWEAVYRRELEQGPTA